MKSKVILPIILLCFVFILLALNSKKEKELVGTWKLVSAKTNGVSNPQIMMDRIFTFEENGTFDGKIFINGDKRPYNSGMFFIPNDSTMVTIHYMDGKKLAPVSFTYNFHIEHDSLHLYGSFLSPAQQGTKLLYMNYIDEWWVKSPGSN